MTLKDLKQHNRTTEHRLRAGSFFISRGSDTGGAPSEQAIREQPAGILRSSPRKPQQLLSSPKTVHRKLRKLYTKGSEKLRKLYTKGSETTGTDSRKRL